jgi:hypothetical protein
MLKLIDAKMFVLGKKFFGLVLYVKVKTRNKMKRNKYIAIWVLVQTTLFLIPLLLAIVSAGYQISRDQHMVNTVNQRAFAEGKGDISSAVVTYMDAQEVYENKVWELNNKEIYYFRSLLVGLLIGIFLQIVNMFWAEAYNALDETLSFDDDDYGEH